MNNLVWFLLFIGLLSFQIQIKCYIWAMIIIYYRFLITQWGESSLYKEFSFFFFFFFFGTKPILAQFVVVRNSSTLVIIIILYRLLFDFFFFVHLWLNVTKVLLQYHCIKIIFPN
jgi:hypothetical protein